MEKLSELLGEVLPPISAAYWALLMVVTALSFLPTAAARANRDFGKVRRLRRGGRALTGACRYLLASLAPACQPTTSVCLPFTIAAHRGARRGPAPACFALPAPACLHPPVSFLKAPPPTNAPNPA